MKQRFIGFWRLISHQGVTDTMGDLEKNRVILTNRLGTIIGVLFLPVIIFDAEVVLKLSATTYILEVLILSACFLVPVINGLGWTEFSKFFMLIVLLTAVSVLGGMASDLTPANIAANRLVVFTLISFPFLLFENRQRTAIAGSVLLVVVTFFLIDPIFHELSLNLPIDKKMKGLNNNYFTPMFCMAVLIFILMGSKQLDVGTVLNLLKEARTKNNVLQQQQVQLKEFNENLENLVDERTSELQTKTVELEQAYNQITDSVYYAKRIQQAVLTDPPDLIRNFQEAFVFFKPKDIVSGDFYWFAETSDPNKQLILAVADCTGHGVPGAFMTIMANDFLNEIVNSQKITTPDRILYELDQKLIDTLRKQSPSSDVHDGLDITIVRLDTTNKRICFAGAKNPLYYVRQGEIKQLPGSKFPIGGSTQYSYKFFELQELTVEPGDVFYLASDGFQDQFGGDLGKKFLKSRFRDLLQDISHLPLSAQEQQLNATLEQWQGLESQTDDILVVGFRV